MPRPATPSNPTRSAPPVSGPGRIGYGRSVLASRSGGDSVRRPQVPVTGDTLEGAGASVVKLEIRTDDEVLDGTGDEHLARSGQGAHARPDVHADAGDVIGPPFDFASVEPGAHLDAERLDSLLEIASSAYPPSRPVKGGQQAVTGALHQDAPVVFDRPCRRRVMLFE